MTKPVNLTQLDRPQVIFLDAVGTLFGVSGSVGEQYAIVARQFGVELAAAEVNQAFIKSFKAAGVPAFGRTEPDQLQAKEYGWWFNIAIDTFKAVNAYHHFSDFAQFFSALYDYFESAKPWYVYDDVISTLKRWQQLGISLGIVSNFDSRIYAVLRSLDLMPYFSSITISTEVGIAKPNPEIFAVALQKHDCPSNAAWHIGDSYREDYEAARSAGLRGIWLRRRES